MNLIIRILVSAIAVGITSYLLPGVTVDGFGSAIIVAIVLGIVNAIIKPILVIFTLPATILTLGLFMFVINALMILLVDAIVGGFAVDGFWWALIFSLIVSLVGSVLSSVLGGDEKKQ